jgi:hypothetical protein
VVGFGIASRLLERNILLNKGIRILIQIIIDAKNETRVTVKMKAGQSKYSGILARWLCKRGMIKNWNKKIIATVSKNSCVCFFILFNLFQAFDYKL